MSKRTMNPDVDTFLNGAKNWQDEMRALRRILLDCDLTEAFKWRTPCYTAQDRNVVLIGAFKNHCVLSFFKGALLKDPNGILTKPGENTQAGRVIRFTSVQEISTLESVLKSYVTEAIVIEKSGLKFESHEDITPAYPEELDTMMESDPALKSAFESLTPGRKRAYIMHFSAAKQSATRTSRIEKCLPRILDGKGLNDCICGHSKRMPNCDGSHKLYP